MQFSLTLKSSNQKTGPIPVTTSSSDTCPDACPLKSANVCYAKHGPLRLVWNRVDATGFTLGELVAKIKALPAGQLWRHNQAGDLPGLNDTLDHEGLDAIVEANRGKRGFTYTHKPLTGEGDVEAIRRANAEGFTVNLSADSLEHADERANLECGPVAVVLPHTVEGNVKITTPEGRRVVVCPATYREDITCATCQLCARANRSTVVGFPAHGTGKKKLETALAGR